MSDGNQNVPGTQTFYHAQVAGVIFNFDKPKKSGGTYSACLLNLIDTQGRQKQESWAMTFLEDARNADLRNLLIQLSQQPGAPVTVHKIVNNSGFWNVERIDMGHVQGVRTTQAAQQQQQSPAQTQQYPGYPAASQPAQQPAQQPAPQAFNYPQNSPNAAQQAKDFGHQGDKMRSKEQCMRGEAVLAAAYIEQSLGKPSVSRMMKNAEVIKGYIENGMQAPVGPAADQEAQAPAQASAQASAPAPQQQAAAPAPAAPAPAPAPAQQPATPAFDDGMGS